MGDLSSPYENESLRKNVKNLPKQGESNTFRASIPGGVNSVCPTSHSRNATRLKLMESRFTKDRAKVLFPVLFGPLTTIMSGSEDILSRRVSSK